MLQSTARAFLTGSLALLSAVATTSPGIAQQAAPRTAPASSKEVNAYVAIGTVTTCILTERKVPFDTALGSSISGVGIVINQLHGGVISGVNNNQKLTEAQITNGVGAQMIAGIKNACYNQLTAADKKKIDDTLKQLQQQQRRN
jgi:outer membrane receptor protein involved in Fe transport